MSRATGITTAAILLGSLALAAGPARAASVDIGKTASAMFPAAAAETYYECEQGSGPSYTVPSGYGVITKWFVNNTAASPGEARLKVFRRLNLTTHFVRGESEIENVLASTLASFPTRVTVQAGDQIGISTQGSVGTIYADGGATGNVACLFNGDPAVGSTPNQSGGNTTVLVNVRAIVETDFDGDGFGDDTQDADDDNDGIPDASDPAPLFADSDLDGAGNAADNCPTTANADQADADRDSSGDACDPDDDNDGLTDSDEARRRTSRVDRDSDDDGLRDDVEVRARLNPAQRDSDRDGLTDGLERGLRRGVPDPAGAVAGTNLRRFRRDLNPRSNTNPRRRDTDHDGLADGREDRNHNGRVDRGETNPLHRDRRPRL
jgi:Thrombospondin type 3 repeat